MPDSEFPRHLAEDARLSDPTIYEESRALIIMVRDICASLHAVERNSMNYALWDALVCRARAEGAVLAFRILPIANRIGWHPEWLRGYAMDALSEMLEKYAAMRVAVPA